MDRIGQNGRIGELDLGSGGQPPGKSSDSNPSLLEPLGDQQRGGIAFHVGIQSEYDLLDHSSTGIRLRRTHSFQQAFEGDCFLTHSRKWIEATRQVAARPQVPREVRPEKGGSSRDPGCGPDEPSAPRL